MSHDDNPSGAVRTLRLTLEMSCREMHTTDTFPAILSVLTTALEDAVRVSGDGTCHTLATRLRDEAIMALVRVAEGM